MSFTYLNGAWTFIVWTIIWVKNVQQHIFLLCTHTRWLYWCLIIYFPPCTFLSPVLSGKGLKVEYILKDDESLTSFLLRDVGLSIAVVNDLTNALLRVEQVSYGKFNLLGYCFSTAQWLVLLWDVCFHKGLTSFHCNKNLAMQSHPHTLLSGLTRCFQRNLVGLCCLLWCLTVTESPSWGCMSLSWWRTSSFVSRWPLTHRLIYCAVHCLSDFKHS